MLNELFTSKIRVKIIKLFLDNLSESFHIRDITRRAGTEINAVRRELDNLSKIGLLKRSSSGNKVFYTVKPDFPLLPEFLVMFAKEFGLPGRLVKELKGIGYCKFLAIHNNLLKKEVKHNRVDVLIVGSISTERLNAIMEKEEQKLDCEIYYSVISEEEFNFLKERKDKFFTDFIGKPFFMMIGDEKEFVNS